MSSVAGGVLPGTVEEFQRLIREQNEKIRDLSAALLQKERELEHKDRELEQKYQELALLRHKLFGRMSEKLSGEDAHQALLFNEAEATAESDPEDPETDSVAVAAHARKKRGRKPLPATLPREERIHDITEEEKFCRCGCALVRIGEERSEELEIIPASAKVIVNIRLKWACPDCDGEENEPGVPAVKIAPVPVKLIPRSIATASLLALIAVGKFSDGLPFSRQEKQFSRIGVDISRQDMSNWMIAVGRAVAPLIAIMQQALREGPTVGADETPVQVHNEVARANTSESRMWVFRGGPPGVVVLLYQYHRTRGSEVTLQYLSGYEGYLQTDDYSGYDALAAEAGITHVGCWAHARRKFVDAQKGGGKSGSADTALSFIAKLYKVEAELRSELAADRISLEQFAARRPRAVVPTLVKLKRWYRLRMKEVPPESLIGKAFSYLHHEWPKLLRYLCSPYLTPDNNAVERAVRPFVIGRRAWLFSGSPAGAYASASLYSLIETAKANGREPWLYLRYLFDRLPHAHTDAEYRALLPYNVDRANLVRSL